MPDIFSRRSPEQDCRQKNSLNVISLSGKMLGVLIEDKKAKEKEELMSIINKLQG